MGKGLGDEFLREFVFVLRGLAGGEIVTAVDLALLTSVLGTVTMYQTGASFSPQGTTFAGQVVDLYVTTLGAWTLPIVYAAVLSTMFSTSLTVIEGYPRALERTVAVLRDQNLDDVGGEITLGVLLEQNYMRSLLETVVLFGKA